MSAPCAGCPCSCEECIFGAAIEIAPRARVKTVVAEKDYGCVHGGSVVETERGAGLLRGNRLHQLTVRGHEFLQQTMNPLANLLSPAVA